MSELKVCKLCRRPECPRDKWGQQLIKSGHCTGEGNNECLSIYAASLKAEIIRKDAVIRGLDELVDNLRIEIASVCSTTSDQKYEYIHMERDIMYRAVKLWGRDSQILMLVEECAELAAAAVRFVNRDRINMDGDLCSECADVELLIGQIRSMGFSNSIDEYKSAKLLRLKDRVEVGEARMRDIKNLVEERKR